MSIEFDGDDPDSELQQHARAVWNRLKLFYGVLGTGALLLIVLGGTAAYQSYGIEGVAVGAVALVVALVLLSRWLLTF